jgi:hypothetical protein
MIKILTAAIAATTLLSLPAQAEPKKMTGAQLDQVVAGEICPPDIPPPPPPTVKVKGNNGWGDGPDTTNPGSFRGGTAPSKSTNSSIPGGGVNEAPQSKFTGR